MTFRRGAIRDAARIQGIFILATLAGCRSIHQEETISRWISTYPLRVFEQATAEDYTVVAEVGAALVGYGRLAEATGEIAAVYVQPDWSGRNIGLRILGSLERRACQLGLQSTSVYSTLNSVGFYQRAGYMLQCKATYVLPDGHCVSCILLKKDRQENIPLRGLHA